MVQERRHMNGVGCEFVVRPNASLSWSHAKAFFVLACVITLGIAAVCWWLGAWVVMAFAGVEMALLAGVLYCCACRAQRREVITIRDGGVEVSRGRRHLERRWISQSYWTWVRLERSRHAWYASRLKLISHGLEIEVGDYLVEEERQDLAKRLETALRA